MLATPTIVHSSSSKGVRPVNPIRDLRQVAELLNLVFGPTLDAEGRRVLESGFGTGRQPLIAARLNQLAAGVVPGFVWEEDGLIIGNVSLLPARQAGRYMVANVAVHPHFRRRGIGRQLMHKVIEHIKERRGRTIFLQVEANNAAAAQLYHSLGFETLGNVRTWDLSQARLRELPLVRADRPGRTAQPPFVRLLHRNEWKAAIGLDRASLDTDLNWPEPAADDAYRGGFWRWLDNFLNGRQSETWVTADEREQLTGLVQIESEWSRPHLIRVRLHPAWRDQVARPLVAKALRRLRYLPRRNARIDHPADDEAVNQMLREANFQVRRTLTVMKFYLGEPDGR